MEVRKGGCVGVGRVVMSCENSFCGLVMGEGGIVMDGGELVVWEERLVG